MTVAWLLVSYLLGGVPASYLAAHLVAGIDLRAHGSGNLGATNAFRVLGARVAIPVLVFDALKGFVPTFFFPLWDGSPAWGWALAYGSAAVLGHVYPVYLGFRGGKGVATASGVFLALAPVAVGIALLGWLATLGVWRIVSLASLASAGVLVVVLALTEHRPPVLALGLAVALFVVWAHRANIRRLLRGEEPRLGRGR